jgi:hypothetical protein
MTDTLPSSEDKDIAVQVDAKYSDPIDGSLWVHKDLVKVRDAWQISPPKASEQFGDVESWAGYVKRYGFNPMATFLAWNSDGLRAVLDYHANDGFEGGPGRMQWTARHPFERSPEWTAWLGIASGHGVPQAKACHKPRRLNFSRTIAQISPSPMRLR